MLPSSLVVTLAITLLGLLTVAVFAVAWRKGQFDRIDRQALLPLDEDDLNVERPWETPAQRTARVAEHGPLHPAATPGVWGGSR